MKRLHNNRFTKRNKRHNLYNISTNRKFAKARHSIRGLSGSVQVFNSATNISKIIAGIKPSEVVKSIAPDTVKLPSRVPPRPNPPKPQGRQKPSRIPPRPPKPPK